MATTEDTASAPPVVSVLIVSRNCADALRTCLQAIERSQQRETIEVIVVDNGSSDGSQSLDSEFHSTTFLRLPRNFGLTKARNIGMRTAIADLILFLSPYVEVAPETIPSLARKLVEDSAAAAVCPLLLDREGNTVPAYRPLPSVAELSKASRTAQKPPGATPDLSSDAVPVEYPDDAALLVRKTFLKGMNYFDERYGEHWSDAELCWQIRRASRKILLLPGVRAVYDTARAQGTAEGSSARALLAADATIGASVYIRRRQGLFAGLRFRLATLLSAVGLLLAARDPGFQFALVKYLVSGQKIDGTQGG
jgi:GT2 family glycosyltransferase